MGYNADLKWFGPQKCAYGLVTCVETGWVDREDPHVFGHRRGMELWGPRLE